MSFGVAFGRKLAVGINIKISFPSLAPEIMDNYGGHQNVDGIFLDFGIIYKYNRNLILGGKIDNLYGSYNWEILNPCDLDKEERTFQEYPPKTIKLGIAYNRYKSISIYFQEDIVSIPGKYINYRSRLGVEYRLPNNVKLRGGLAQIRGDITSDEKIYDINLKPSFGAGIPIKVWKKQSLQMDYALDLGSVGEGLSHLFSFSVQLK